MTGCPVGQGVSGLYYEYQKNSLSYDDVLCQQAKKSMLWISLIGLVGLSLISLLSARVDSIAGLAYMPAILITIVTVCFFISSGYKSFPYYRVLAGFFLLYMRDGCYSNRYSS